MRDEDVTDVASGVVRDLNRERVRHGDRLIFSCSESGARAARGVYEALRGAGEADAVPFTSILVEEGDIRNISAEIVGERASEG